MIAFLLVTLAASPAPPGTSHLEAAAAGLAKSCLDSVELALGQNQPERRLQELAEACSGLVRLPRCGQAWRSGSGRPLTWLAATCAREYCPVWSRHPPEACGFDWASAKIRDVHSGWSGLLRSILAYDWGVAGSRRIEEALRPWARRLAVESTHPPDRMTPLVALAAPDFTVRVNADDDSLTATIEDAKGDLQGTWRSSNRCEMPGPPFDEMAAQAAHFITEKWRPWASYTLKGGRKLRFCKVKAAMLAFENAGLFLKTFHVEDP